MNEKTLNETALAMVAPGKGILAADESTGTIKKRFDGIGIENSESNRRAYRGMLFGTPGIEAHIAGVILFGETLFQKSDDDVPFPELLAARGIVSGIKVDQGARPLAGGGAGETVTEGLDGLRERLQKYKAAGVRFAKWRGVIAIGNGMPSDLAVHVNAHALGRYAALCQEADIVPIVEPEVLMDADNSIEVCEAVTERVLAAVFDELYRQKVLLEGMVLKPNMVVSGIACGVQAPVQEVAERTLRCLKRRVPAAVPGIAFLSGGQNDQLATAHLDAMNRIGGVPWKLSFSFGRALQAAALAAWRGECVAPGQLAHAHRARMNGLAALGQWDAAMEHGK